jgi:HEPN domain-containing protein
MLKRPVTRPVSRAQSRGYLSKAEEYVAAAADELDSGRSIAATSLAIHAAINAADAVCGARLGTRAAGQDHGQVILLLQDAGRDGVDIERNLRRLLPLKTKAEYEPEGISISAASKAVDRAQRCVDVARRVISTR